MRSTGATLENARQLADVSLYDLWLRYFAIGGTESRVDLQSFLCGDHEFGAEQHDVLVHALNERFVELDMARPVPYAADEDPDFVP